MDIEIQNPTFDRPYERQGGDVHLHIAHGWRAWWYTGPSGTHGGDHRRPEYYEKREGEVSAQAWQTTYATHRAGVYQVIELPQAPIIALHASILARYHSQEGGKRGDLALRLGLQPGAGVDGTSDQICWGPWRGQTDGTGWDGVSWEPLVVTLEDPPAGRVTLFVESRCQWPVRDNHAFVDAVVLTASTEDDGETDGDLLAVLREIRDLVEQIAEDVEALRAG